MASEASSTPTNVKAEAETSTNVVVVEEKEKKMLVLKSKDDEIFEVDIEVVSMSETIKQMLEDDVSGATIPLPNVTGRILAKVIEYCNKHVDDSKDIRHITPVSSELSDWDKDFVKVDNDVLIDLYTGCKLSEHQEFIGPRVSGSSRYHQGILSRRSQGNLQH